MGNKTRDQRVKSSIRDYLQWSWRFLVRVDVVSTLIVVVLLLAALGSCFPPKPTDIENDATLYSSWKTSQHIRYGVFANFLLTIGAFHFYRSPIFLIPLVLLSLSTFICTLDRWRVNWRRAFTREVSCSDALFSSSSHTAILTTPEGADIAPSLKDTLIQAGFRVRIETVDELLYIRADRNRLSHIATLISHLGVVFLLIGTLLSCSFGWREELSLLPDAPIGIMNQPGIALRNDGFSIERYPDGSAAGFEAFITLFDGNQESLHENLRLNEPITYRGISLYLQGFALSAHGHVITILVVHDPGFGLIVASGLMLLFGLTVSFNFPHSCIHARLEPPNTLRLAGNATRRAYDFEREFNVLVSGLAVGIGGE